MSYAVKEIFYTLQGEGANAGRPAVFCRFSGCNLWNGREADRATSVCSFCDTDFVGTDGAGGGRFETPRDLAEAVARRWPRSSPGHPFVVFTGGEPLLQLDEELVRAVHDSGFEVAIETNGTLRAVEGIDWICVSPKAGAPLVQDSGHELKLVYPQEGLQPQDLEHLSFTHRFLQPLDGPRRAEDLSGAIRFCLQRPLWRLSVQTHKLIGIP